MVCGRDHNEELTSCSEELYFSDNPTNTEMARNMREVRGFLCNDEYVIQKAKVTVHHFVETEAWAQILPRDRDEDVEVGEVGDDPVSHASSAAEVDVMSLKLKLLFLLKESRDGRRRRDSF